MGMMNTAENAVEVRDVKKSFKVYADRAGQLKERILFWKRNRYEERKVLDGVSFDVKKGEAVGLIGQNGCGKSTTLKLLTRIIYPDSGSIQMNGRVSSLIELGAGFHPDMSGRENIYTNAAIFGLTKKEIDARLDDIIAFSELEEFIDNPVRTYSSGMYMRLAFAVAINVDADILLIDEILAVGDAAFQSKCFNRMREIKAKGTTIILVSHSLGQIEQLCDRSIWIHEGKIRMEGIPRDVHPHYMDHMADMTERAAEKRMQEAEAPKELKEPKEPEATAEETTEEVPAEEQADPQRYGNRKAEITSITLNRSDKQNCHTLRSGEDAEIVIAYKVHETVRNAAFGIGIFRNDGVQCYGTNTVIDKLDDFDLEKDGKMTIRIQRLSLLQGSYAMDVAIECDQGIPVDYYKNAIQFEVSSRISDVGVGRVEHTWDLENVIEK